jgi:hypothetical protein
MIFQSNPMTRVWSEIAIMNSLSGDSLTQASRLANLMYQKARSKNLRRNIEVEGSV